MKRSRKRPTNMTSKKSTQRGLEKSKEDILNAKVVNEERIEVGKEQMGLFVSETNVMNSLEENYWPWLSCVAYEQMYWGYIWLPIWDVEFMGDACNDQLFSDVFCDHDIWGIRDVGICL